jgi:hypothetical protein
MIEIRDNKVFDFSIENYTVEDSAATEFVPAGNYVRLCKGGKLITSNTQLERISNAPFIRNAHGDVFIAGLGIGYLIDMLKDRQFTNIKSITVIELYREIIDLVMESLPEDIDIMLINRDVRTFRTHKMYDTIYFDIWSTYDNEIFKNEMQPLMAKFAGNLRKDGWMGCWAEDAAKNNIPLEQYLRDLKKSYML